MSIFKHLGHSKGGKKFGHGLVKRMDSVGKFSGKIIKQQQDTISGAIGNLTNPMVLIVAGVCAVFIFINYN